MIGRAQDPAVGRRSDRLFRFASAIVVLTLWILAVLEPAVAQEQLARTTQRVTVHETPSGAVVDGIPADRPVVVMSRQGSWARVEYHKVGITLNGWVALAHFDLGTGAAAVPQYKAPEPEPALPKGTHVTIMTTRLDCRERVGGGGFETCAVHVQAPVLADVVPRSRLMVLIACGAEITTHSRFAPYQKARELAKKTFPLNSIFSIHQLKIDFRLPAAVTSVDGEEARCLLEPAR